VYNTVVHSRAPGTENIRFEALGMSEENGRLTA
jgi:hypothetical protein